ncbi:GNAT family N-acetyltransferase [Nitrospirillum sp. BR 11752]|uniref:GNAT family N-acetyltransferase n=1 Tax=Nitrospirillum sp. BR 11752 TaxID=3104293 RepID=UPI002EA402B4|nr:GNAT family N-acetyltransferase [Nitrospirillum sp. BR 11752]
MTSFRALRPVMDTDLPVFFAQQADPIAADQAVFGTARSDDEGAFLAKWAVIRANPDLLTRTVEADGGVAGYVAHFIQEGQPSISYWLGRAYWGRGIATAAVAAFVAGIAIRPLYARVAVSNTASAGVLIRNGFRLVGSGQAHSARLDQWVDEGVFRLDAGVVHNQ